MARALQGEAYEAARVKDIWITTGISRWWPRRAARMTRQRRPQRQQRATTAATTAGPYVPASPECVAPSDPGGGWDFTCRTIGQLFEDLGLTSNVVTTNQPGGGGGVAFADIAANRSDNSDLVIAASPATAIRFAQNQYTGLEADQFRWIGAIGADFGVVAVTQDSRVQHPRRVGGGRAGRSDICRVRWWITCRRPGPFQGPAVHARDRCRPGSCAMGRL